MKTIKFWKLPGKKMETDILKFIPVFSHHLHQTLANFFERQDDDIFGLVSLLELLSSVIFFSNREYINECAWLCSNEIGRWPDLIQGPRVCQPLTYIVTDDS